MAINIKDINKQSNNKSNAQRDLDFSRIKLSFSGSFPDKIKESFFSDLGMLINSGIDIKTSLEIIIDENKKSKNLHIYESIRKDLINGKSLSESINKTNKFSKYEYYNLKIGEESGQLNRVLLELSKYYNDKITQKRQLVNALSYPILVLVVAIVVVIFMMNVIVPMFRDVFSRFNSELPYLTTVVIQCSDFLTNNLFFIFIGIFALAVFVYYYHKKNWFRRILSQTLLKVPLIGNLVNKIYLSRFCHSMSLLISTKVPLLDALDLVKNMISFYPYEIASSHLKADILSGKPLHQSMKNHSIFDSRTISLVKVAEEVNQLDVIFNKLYLQYSEENKHKIAMLNSVLEPLLIIFVGILVGIILISMYLPLFQLSSSFY
ncbi:MAG: type II secretion system F family protein [Candidatus Delongbacteria bacterium]|nr:type II secretion system F family protein [Candidatus Delongbacteria bacterium]